MAGNSVNQETIQTLLDSKELNGYWHIDVLPERIPLKISLPKELEHDQIQLTKFSRPVMVLNIRDAQFIIVSINLKGGQREIQFEYRPEGLRGKALFEPSADKWILTTIEIHEK